MELPKIKKSEHGMLDGIKSKLGFAEADRGYDERYEDDYGEGYGDYGDLDEYGPTIGMTTTTRLRPAPATTPTRP